MEVPEKVRMVVYMVNAVNLMWAQDEINNPLHGSANFTCVHDYIASGGRLLIEGIGMQQHDHINNRSHARTEEAIIAYASTGARISITELDVGVGGYTGECWHLSEFDELRQAIYYARLFDIFKRHSEHIHRVSFWGLCDGRNWRRSELPLLFDPDLRTKLAFYAVADPIGFLEERGNPHLVLP
jgi:endo-1,4-beta-xylanase